MEDVDGHVEGFRIWDFYGGTGRVGAGVAGCAGYDGDGAETGFACYGYCVKVAIRAGEENLQQIAVHKGKESLGLRVAKADIVFQHAETISCNHDASEQETFERHTFGSHTVDGGLKYRSMYLFNELLISDGRRGITTHAPCIGSLVAIKDLFVVLSRDETLDSVAVDEAEKGEFLAGQILFDDHLVACGSEFPVHHHLSQCVLSFVFR